MHKRGWLVFLSLTLLLAAGCRRSEKKRIGVVPKAVAHVFWQSVHAGAVAAGREADVDIDWIGPPQETDFSRQIEIVDAMINSRVDALVLAPTEATALVNVVERAGKAGIPVAIFDSGINTEEYVSFVSTNNYQAGVLAAKKLAELLDNKGINGRQADSRQPRRSLKLLVIGAGHPPEPFLQQLFDGLESRGARVSHARPLPTEARFRAFRILASLATGALARSA